MTAFFQSIGMSYNGAWFTATISGILLIGFINLTVSFSLALWIALRARGVGFSQTRMLASILFTRLKANWRQFFWPQAN